MAEFFCDTAMITLSNNITIPEGELEFSAIRAQGSGGQNVNKVSSALHLRFNIPTSSLPDFHKQNLMAMRDSRISKEGVLVIKAQKYRTQEKNRQDALERLRELLEKAGHVPKARRATKPTKASKTRRLEGKSLRAKVKSMRGKVPDQ